MGDRGAMADGAEVQRLFLRRTKRRRTAEPAPEHVAPEGEVALMAQRGLFLVPKHALDVVVRGADGDVVPPSVNAWDVQTAVQKLLVPLAFKSCNLVSRTDTVLSFVAEAKEREQVPRIIETLNKREIKFAHNRQHLVVRVREHQPLGTTEAEWLAEFPAHFDDCSAGKRPDTVAIRDVPIRWFSSSNPSAVDEKVVREAFGQFGPVRAVHAEINQPAAADESDIALPALHCTLFVQYATYPGFVAALTTLRTRKLVRRTEEKDYEARISVRFDTEGYLSLAVIDKRRQAAELAKQRALLEEQERERKRLRREQQAEQKRLAEEKRQQEEQARRERKEQRRLAKEQRRLEAEQRAREEQQRREADFARVVQAEKLLQALRDEQAALEREEAARLAFLKSEIERKEEEKRQAQKERLRRALAAERRVLQQQQEQAEAEERAKREAERQQMLQVEEEARLRAQLERNLRILEERKRDVLRQMTLRKLREGVQG
eukprot:m.242860 g.242860  ORF g.242860 m.242860 type:complete len:491 (-) comp19014_c0_seq5:78-1550(-)